MEIKTFVLLELEAAFLLDKHIFRKALSVQALLKFKPSAGLLSLSDSKN